MPTSVVNARIRRAELGYEGHGILTALIDFEWPDHAQAFPQYNLNGTLCAPWIKAMLDTVSVGWWGELKGKIVRLEVEDGWRPIAMGHVLEDRWFNPHNVAEECRIREDADA